MSYYYGLSPRHYMKPLRFLIFLKSFLQFVYTDVIFTETDGRTEIEKDWIMGPRSHIWQNWDLNPGVSETIAHAFYSWCQTASWDLQDTCHGANPCLHGDKFLTPLAHWCFGGPPQKLAHRSLLGVPALSRSVARLASSIRNPSSSALIPTHPS